MSGLKIGYARVSTDAQDLTAQRDALDALGVDADRVYVDHSLTGTHRDRPGLRQALAACRAGDEVHHGGLAYTAVKLAELVGDDVELAFAPHDQRAIEVYWRGAWLCTAHPHDALSASEQEQILTERRRYAGELRRRQRRAQRQGKGRLAPATARSRRRRRSLGFPLTRDPHANAERAVRRRYAQRRGPTC